MPEIKCKICKNEFYAKPSWIKQGFGKFCSRECFDKSRRTGEMVHCFICKKLIYKTQKALKGSKSKKYFCSKSCQTIWRNSIIYTGSKHPNWKNGKFTYRRIIENSNKPRICTLCKTGDLRVLAVHHLDKNKNNNKLENLAWLCHNCHFLVHAHKSIENELKFILSAKSP